MNCLRSFICLCLIALPFFAAAQENSPTFPDSYFGIYKGDLEIFTERGNYKIPMEFHMLPTDSLKTYTYTLVYGADAERQERRYSLIETNGTNGKYIVDEHNGIVLDNKVIGNKMFSLFEVQGNLLTTFITFEEDHLLFEITFADKSNVRSSEVENQPENKVLSHPISTIQKGKLIKQ